MEIIAHRGLSGLEPENTLLAINAALELNVDGIEIDLYEIDGKIIVIHDRILDRTTSGKGQITDHSFKYLRTLDAGKREKIPTLDEALNLINGRTVIHLELKCINNPALLFSYLDDAVKNTPITASHIILSSFNHHILNEVHQKRPEFPIGALTSCIPLDYAKFAQELNAYSVNVHLDFINQKFVTDAHQKGMKIFVYTVDRKTDIKTMMDLAVDGIFSNFPHQAKQYLKCLQKILDHPKA
ncbi:MAG: glycerophosphodiester phosphodiesterase [Psychromonas sp.]|nr:glycerophosphodiester phosphodiesterase [Psychromonas sp.]